MHSSIIVIFIFISSLIIIIIIIDKSSDIFIINSISYTNNYAQFKASLQISASKETRSPCHLITVMYMDTSCYNVYTDHICILVLHSFASTFYIKFNIFIHFYYDVNLDSKVLICFWIHKPFCKNLWSYLLNNVRAKANMDKCFLLIMIY